MKWCILNYLIESLFLQKCLKYFFLLSLRQVCFVIWARKVWLQPNHLLNVDLSFISMLLFLVVNCCLILLAEERSDILLFARRFLQPHWLCFVANFFQTLWWILLLRVCRNFISLFFEVACSHVGLLLKFLLKFLKWLLWRCLFLCRLHPLIL